MIVPYFKVLSHNLLTPNEQNYGLLRVAGAQREIRINNLQNAKRYRHDRQKDRKKKKKGRKIPIMLVLPPTISLMKSRDGRKCSSEILYPPTRLKKSQPRLQSQHLLPAELQIINKSEYFVWKILRKPRRRNYLMIMSITESPKIIY